MGTAVLVVVAAAAAALTYAVWRVNRYRPLVTADEVHEVTTPDLWKIRLFRYKPANGGGEPIFFCHGFMSNQFNFALPEGDSMAEYFAGRGYDCWLIELRGNASSIPPFGRKRIEPSLDDYLLRDIPAAIQYIRKATGYKTVHWIGHSMGGMLLYAYDAVFGRDHLSCATTLGSPIGFEGYDLRRPTVLFWLRRLSGPLFRAGQWLLVRTMTKLRKAIPLIPVNWDNMHPRLDGKMLFAMLEPPPLPVARGMMDAVESKKWPVNNGQIDVFAHLPHLHTPLFAIYGAADPFVPMATGVRFFENLKQTDKKLLLLSKDNNAAADYNHVDLVMGRESRTEVFPAIEEWLEAHPLQEMSPDEMDADAVRKPPQDKPRRAAKTPRVKKTAPGPGKAAAKSPPKTSAPRKKTDKKNAG